MAKPEPEENLELPQKLRDALANYSNQRVFVPPQRDEAVLKLAKERLQSRQIASRRAPWGWWSAAAAALLVLLIWSSQWTTERRRPLAPNPVPLAQRSGDIDGNGVVDIFDAFLLARHLNEQPTATAWDVNGDGVVNSRDVTTIAQRAVQLPKGRVL